MKKMYIVALDLVASLIVEPDILKVKFENQDEKHRADPEKFTIDVYDVLADNLLAYRFEYDHSKMSDRDFLVDIVSTMTENWD